MAGPAALSSIPACCPDMTDWIFGSSPAGNRFHRLLLLHAHGFPPDRHDWPRAGSANSLVEERPLSEGAGWPSLDIDANVVAAAKIVLRP